MSSVDLKKISDFIETNNSFSDFNHVSSFLANLNYTKFNFKNKSKYNLKGGNEPEKVEVSNQALVQDPNQALVLAPNQEAVQTPVQTSIQVPNQEVVQAPVQTSIQAPIQEVVQAPVQVPIPTDTINTYTIPEGTILYHATTNKKGFNPNYLKLGKDKLINFFTPDFKLASNGIESCSVDKQNGYIHVFRVIKPIPNIYVRLPYDITDDINSDVLANEFCSQNQNYYGIGFFYPKNNIEMFSSDKINNFENISNINNQLLSPNSNPISNSNEYYSEFGLCNPRPYLEYLYSQKCMSLRKLSEPYRFD